MSIRKRVWTSPNGNSKQRWVVDYKDQTGKRRSKQFERKKDAEAWELNARSEVVRGVHTPDSISIDVEAAAKLWLAGVRRAGREPTTIAAYDQHVRLHILPKCGGVRLSQITAPMVKGYLNGWLKDLSRPMAVRVLRTFKSILTNARDEGFVAQNVALEIKPAKASRGKPKAKPPTKGDLKVILKAVEETEDQKAAAIVSLAIYSGMRASELRGLAWDCLDLKNGRVEIEQRADAKGTLGPPKSEAGYRRIPLGSSATKALKAWKLKCPPNDENLVFPSERGRVLSHTVLMNKLVGPLQVAAGITSPGGKKPRYGMHAFRHAAASLWIEQKLNAKKIQNLMGHASITVTFDTYGHLFLDADSDAEVARAIDEALFGRAA